MECNTAWAWLLGAVSRYRQRRCSQRGLARAQRLLGLLAAVLIAVPASAQPASGPSQSIDMQQYKPGPGQHDVLGMYSPWVAPHLGWSVGLSFSYAKDPLNVLIRSPHSDELLYELIKHQRTFDLMGSIALLDRFELGVALPITSQSSASLASLRHLPIQRVDATGVGDLRVVPKAHLLSTRSGLRLGVAVPLLFPTSGGHKFLGRNDQAVQLRLLAERSTAEGARVLANVGVNFQPREQLYNLNVSTEFAYGLGMEVPFQLGRHPFVVETTLVGAIGMRETSPEECPLELLTSMKYQLATGLAVNLGGGLGLTSGYGTPGFRMFAGLTWAGRTQPGRAKSSPTTSQLPHSHSR